MIEMPLKAYGQYSTYSITVNLHVEKLEETSDFLIF